MRRPCWTLNEATQGIGGEFPQNQEMGKGYDYGASNSVHRLPNEDLPDFEPNFNTIMIAGSARLTDLISSSPIPKAGLLVSQRFGKLLEQFNLPIHRFYSVPMVHRKKPITGYRWLHLAGSRLPITDSTSPEEVEAVINADGSLFELDLLRVYRPPRYAYFFVSAPLHDAILKEKITGVRFGMSKIFR